MNRNCLHVVTLSLALSALWAVAPAHAELKALGNSDAATYYVDTNTVRRSGPVRTFWSIMDYNQTQTTTRGAPYLSTRSNMEMNCREQTVLMRQFSMHSGRMAQGEVLDTQGVWRDAQAIPPGTPLAVIMKFVCS
jgi:hypothetical protein